MKQVSRTTGSTHEAGWIALEAAALNAIRPPIGSPQRPGWDARWEAHETRKRVLLAYVARRRSTVNPGLT